MNLKLADREVSRNGFTRYRPGATGLDAAPGDRA